MKQREGMAVQNTFGQELLNLLNNEGNRDVLSKVQINGLYYSINELLAQILAHVIEPEATEGEEDGKEYGAGLNLEDFVLNTESTVAQPTTAGDNNE
jgi:hypothetical protein